MALVREGMVAEDLRGKAATTGGCSGDNRHNGRPCFVVSDLASKRSIMNKRGSAIKPPMPLGPLVIALQLSH